MEIHLRQAEEDPLSFVSIEELVGETVVTIATSQIINEADYELKLESFDKTSAAKSSLFTDIINITVRAREVPT